MSDPRHIRVLASTLLNDHKLLRLLSLTAQVNMPGHICAVVVTTLVLEGWSSQLDPRHSVIEQVSAANSSVIFFLPSMHEYHMPAHLSASALDGC